uniref:Uncharacterized protein n=1 Tax=Arundo donax TaxID=35708 RepID=A0A0A9FSS0_ARUDO
MFMQPDCRKKFVGLVILISSGNRHDWFGYCGSAVLASTCFQIDLLFRNI